jgi:hypothetical protein
VQLVFRILTIVIFCYNNFFCSIVSRKSVESISDRCDCFVLFPACKYCVTNFLILFVVFAEVRCVVAWRPGHPPLRVHSLSRAAASLGDRVAYRYIAARVCVKKTGDARCVIVQSYCIFAVFNFFYCILVVLFMFLERSTLIIYIKEWLSVFMSGATTWPRHILA